MDFTEFAGKVLAMDYSKKEYYAYMFTEDDEEYPGLFAEFEHDVDNYFVLYGSEYPFIVSDNLEKSKAFLKSIESTKECKNLQLVKISVQIEPVT